MDYLSINRDTYNALAEEYQGHWQDYLEHETAVLRPFIDELTKRFGSSPQVLDAGCGVGLDAHILSNVGCRVTALDAAPRMTEFARLNAPLAQVRVGDFLTSEFDGKFDGLVMTAFLQLFPSASTTRVLDKAREFLAENGLCFISVTASDVLREGFELKTEYQKRLLRYRTHWTDADLERALVNGGFRVHSRTEDLDPIFHRHWINVIAVKA